MTTGYKQYNNYSQQDKDSMRTLAADTSNTNETTLINQTDQVESLLSTLIQKVEAINTNTDAVESKLDSIIGYIDGLESTVTTIESDLTTINSSVQGTTYEVTSQGQAIVQAIQGQ